MSTAVATIDTNNLNYQEIAALTGQDNSNGGLARLFIQHGPEDAEGKPVPAGTFTYVDDKAGPVFARAIRFQPYLNAYQYTLIGKDPADNTKNKLINKSVIFTDFRDEIPDILGTQRCGKITGDAGKSLTGKAADDNKLIKCTRLLYGVVTMVDAFSGPFSEDDKKGQPVTVDPAPVLFAMKGANFMMADTAIKSLNRSKRLMIQTRLAMTLDRQKNGSVTYYTANVQTTDDVVPVNADTLALLTKFKDTVAFENASVMERYRAALKGQPLPNDDDVYDATSQLLGDADFDA